MKFRDMLKPRVLNQTSEPRAKREEKMAWIKLQIQLRQVHDCRRIYPNVEMMYNIVMQNKHLNAIWSFFPMGILQLNMFVVLLEHFMMHIY